MHDCLLSTLNLIATVPESLFLHYFILFFYWWRKIEVQDYHIDVLSKCAGLGENHSEATCVARGDAGAWALMEASSGPEEIRNGRTSLLLQTAIGAWST